MFVIQFNVFDTLSNARELILLEDHRSKRTLKNDKNPFNF